jgi:hypothetical protein
MVYIDINNGIGDIPMNIKKTSVFSGITRTKDIPVNPQDYALWEQGYANIDESMPYLTEEDREFILSGMTPTEWKNAFSEEIMEIVGDTFV